MNRLMLFVLLAGMTMWQATASLGAENGQLDQQQLQRITKEVHHELVLLPNYGVFDNLEYEVAPDGTVTLLGQVSQPVVKSEAQNAVKNIEGVSKIDNQIEVLPPSPADDRIRRATLRAIYKNASLSLYSMKELAPIHIIVKNGHVTLIGFVSRQMDKQLADIQARSVPGVFSVTDQLQVVGGK